MAIRVDGNPKLGIGHVMRCLSIAKAARDVGASCVFITADIAAEKLIRESGFEQVCLESRWDDLENDLTAMARVICELKIDTLLVDSYYVTERYLFGLCELTRVVYLDDLDSFIYPCHALINYNCYAESLKYAERYGKTRLLLGPKYAPLREEFSERYERTVLKVARSVLITTGGMDPLNVAGTLIKLLSGYSWFSGMEFDVVAGGLGSYIDELRSLEKKHENVRLHVDTREMSRLMRKADIAVSAGGSTMYELCACATPTICFALADNQFPGVREFSSRGVMIYAGDVRESGYCPGRICEAVEGLVYDQNARETMARKMSDIVDGRGAKRIAEFLIDVNRV